MAAPTYAHGAIGLQLALRTKATSQGENDLSTYSYQNFIEIFDKESDRKIHIILDIAVPGAFYNSAPIGSIHIDTLTGLMKIKDAAGENWAAVDVTT